MGNVIKYAFRITHIDNIPHVIKFGLVRKDSPCRNINFVNIGDQNVIKSRAEIIMKDYRIGDYIPFYFGPRSPMLYVIQHGYNNVQRVEPEKIVYCVIKLDNLINKNVDCVFTDGHALSALTNFYTKDRLSQINDIVKYADVYSTYWNSENDIDLKRRKEAELLVKNDLPVCFICGYVVYNEKAKQKLIEMGIADNMIAVVPNYYF